VIDASQRSTAIDPLRSFCVSAPAGSGKTELLIQRYLLLLSRVKRPEQVLAITFTRKAAAEMRERVVAALEAAGEGATCSSPHEQVTRRLAEQAMAADEAGEWHLLRDISRLNIKTIDSFCAGLTRQMPILSEFGGQAAPRDDAEELYAEAVLDLFQEVEGEGAVAADLAALMRHFDNNWERLRDLLVGMLGRREQWRHYLGVHLLPEESEAYLLSVVERLVEEQLAGLSAALDPYREELLDLQRYAAANLGHPPPEAFPGVAPGEVASWRALADMVLTQNGGWRKQVTKAQGFPTGSGEARQRKDQIGGLLRELAEIEGLEQRLVGLRYLPLIERGAKSWQLLVHLSRLLPRLAAQLLLVFQRHGAVDHNQIALSALRALGDDDNPTELALRLDYNIEHILVDEFQDTSVNQYELLRSLTRGWAEHNATNPGAPRTVMIVGDGMQSIYGFRGANVGLFLQARNEGFNGLQLEPLELLANFRSDAGVVEWVNATFSAAFPGRDDVERGQVKYTEAAAIRPAVHNPAVAMHAFHGDHALAQEVAFICGEVAAAVADPECGSVALLGRSRSHLQPLIASLKQAGIPYSAQEMDSLAESMVVTDLFNLCRALANSADRLAWMALLRAPWCGLALADLLEIGRCGTFARHTSVWSTLNDSALPARLSPDGRSRVLAILPTLQRALAKRDRLSLRVWIEAAWMDLNGPACAPEASELEDAESFFQLLEQAEREGAGLDIEWLQRRLEKSFMSGGEPSGKVQVMTLHKAKGLEFDQVIIPQLARPPRSEDRQLLLWDEHSGPGGERSFLLAADDHSVKGEPTLYNYLKQQRDDKSLLEGTRLLYVGTTRAVSRLLLTAGLDIDQKTGEFRAPTGRSLLSPIWPSFREQMTVHEPWPVAGAAIARDLPPPLVRLSQPIATGSVTGEPLEEVPEANIPERPVNHLERSVGTAVHLALEELSLRDRLPRDLSDSDRERWRQVLRRLGLWGAPLEQAATMVEESVAATLAEERGRWILQSDHRDARSEWCLTQLSPEGEPKDLIIDRTFIDRQEGVRWVVDYKTSRPADGESLPAFLASEADNYRTQLARYRDALAVLGDEPIRCALYFTALGLLHPVPDLDTRPDLN
jgi:ATP-dependent exoDNAse (exonuclease V) beta subunit